MAREVKDRGREKRDDHENKGKRKADADIMAVIALSDWKRWGTHLLVTKMLSAAAAVPMK